MIINKLGHCCLLIKHKGLSILTDPGNYTEKEVSEIKNIDLIIITHEHPDHLHIDSLKVILRNNPEAKIITNSAVGALLDNEGIVYQVLEQDEKLEVDLEPEGKMMIEAYGKDHAFIYENIVPVENTGYFIDDILFYPGDAFTNPGKKVDILALPVAGPWLKIGESINYALEVKPRVCFPVHDALLKEFGTSHRLPAQILAEKGVEFIELDGKGDVELTEERVAEAEASKETNLEQNSPEASEEEGTMGL